MSKLTAFAGTLASSSVAGAALDVAIKIAVLLALAFIVTRALRTASAAVRHSIWSAAIVGALVLPVLAVALPSWHLALPGAAAARSLAGRVSAAVEDGADAPGTVTVAASEPDPVSAPGTQKPAEVAATVRGGTNEQAMPAGAAVAASAAPTTGPVDVPVRRPPARLPLTLFAIWLAGSALALVPLLLGALQLRAIERRSHDVESDALDDYAARLGRTLGIRRVVRVVEGEAAATPMTWGVLHPVVLVPAGFESWPESRQRDVLLHELAHVARYDCLTQHLARVACALHWYNPLAWVAARRLRIERERACDDRVLLAGARASEYAEHILTIARTLRTPGMAGAAALAMARPSHLEGRLLALLDGRRRRAVLTRGRAMAIGASAIAVAAVIATLSPFAARAEASEATAPRQLPAASHRERSDTDTVKAGSRHVMNDSLYRALQRLLESPQSDSTSRILQRLLESAGSDSTYRSMNRMLDALQDTETGRQLRARLDSMNSGMRTEVVDGQRVTHGPGSVVVRNTEGAKSSNPSEFRLPGCTLAAHRSSSATVSDNDSHVKASVKNGDCEITLEREGEIGFNDDFTDITKVESDGWVAIYDRGGSDTHKLRITSDGGTLTRAWSVNGEKRQYDAEAARWLAAALSTLDRYTNFSRGARIAVVYRQRGVNGVLDEVATNGSDYGKRSEIERLLKLAKLDQQQTERILGFAQTEMSSDYDKQQLLKLLLDEKLVTPALHAKYIAAAATVTSDYDRRQTLTALVDAGGLSVESQAAVMNAARTITSDYDMREMLLAVVKKYPLTKATLPAFVAAAGRISSDYDMRTLLTTVMDEQQNLDPAIVDTFLDLGAKRISSDYDKSEFFISIARSGPNTEVARERIAKAAESIQSESDYGRVLSAIRKLKNTSGGR